MTPAADLHDNINVVITSLIFFSAAFSLAGLPPGHTVVTFGATAYIIFDVVWVMSQPRIVKSPVEIILHHLGTLAVLYDPITVINHQKYASCALLVEINTVLITLRRRLGRPMWCEVSFLATWLALRLIWFPCLSYWFLCSSFPEVFTMPFGIARENDPPIDKLTTVFFCLIVLLQFYWTFALGSSVLKRKDKAAQR